MTLPGAIKEKAWYHRSLSNVWKKGTHKLHSLISAFWGGECYYLANQLAKRWWKSSLYSMERRSGGVRLFVIKRMTKHTDQFHLRLLFTLKKRCCFLHNNQTEKASRSRTCIRFLSFFLVRCSKDFWKETSFLEISSLALADELIWWFSMKPGFSPHLLTPPAIQRKHLCCASSADQVQNNTHSSIYPHKRAFQHNKGELMEIISTHVCSCLMLTDPY